MAIYVKGYRRGASHISPYRRRNWGGRRNPDRLEEVMRRLDSSMMTRRKLSGYRKLQINRTINRIQKIYEHQAAVARRSR